jgi:transcriptional regulatory protein RtcR
MKRKIVIGLLGSILDRGQGRKRWDNWRPTVSLGQFEDLLIDRVELLHDSHSQAIADVVKEDLKVVSPESTIRLHEMNFADAWDFEEVYSALYDFARDYPFDTEQEEYYLHITTGTHVAQICQFLLSESRVVPASLIQTSPPNRNRGADPGSYSIIDLDLSKYNKIHERFDRQTRSDVELLKSGIVTRNTAFNKMIDEIERVAIRSKAPLLLLGPTGAGKSQLASQIYKLKKSHNIVEGNFTEVNCATLRGDQAMSMLFGHTKGAFTGAMQARGGLLKSAHGGILFLDEIGELGADEQAMLLRALETGRFLPLGSDVESESTFQLIAGTNHDLSNRVRTGHFRQDLLARINMWMFELPGLANRVEDIAPNIEYELEQFELTAGQRVRFTARSYEKFLSFATSPEATWAGNFRDLNAAITRMATLSTSGRILPDSVDTEINRLKSSWSHAGDAPAAGSLADYLDDDQLSQIDLFDQHQLNMVIGICRRSRSLSDAGRTLFGASRLRKQSSNDSDRLRKYLGKFSLTWQDVN